MKFIRYGDLKAFEQTRHKKCPGVDEYPHSPPRRRGFFAFPYAFFDQFYIMRRPACSPNSSMMYLRDKRGRKLTEVDLQVFSDTEVDCDSTAPVLKPKVIRTLSDNELLKSLGLPKQPIVREPRPSWVCVMRDPKHPPRRTENGSLSQKFDYLTDEDGERVMARDFFEREWRPGDFDCSSFYYEACKPSDILADACHVFALREKRSRLQDDSDEASVKLTVDYLRRRGIRVERLFAWPVYEPGEDSWLTIFKKPHLFDHQGCVWHHLRKFVSPGSVLSSYGTTWVYTTVHDFERALRRAEPKAYGKQKSLRDTAKAGRFGGPSCYNATFSIDGMYEVFFDEEDIKKIT